MPHMSTYQRIVFSKKALMLILQLKLLIQYCLQARDEMQLEQNTNDKKGNVKYNCSC